jgi:hypothetical protein
VEPRLCSAVISSAFFLGPAIRIPGGLSPNHRWRLACSGPPSDCGARANLRLARRRADRRMAIGDARRRPARAAPRLDRECQPKTIARPRAREAGGTATRRLTGRPSRPRIAPPGAPTPRRSQRRRRPAVDDAAGGPRCTRGPRHLQDLTDLGSSISSSVRLRSCSSSNSAVSSGLSQVPVFPDESGGQPRHRRPRRPASAITPRVTRSALLSMTIARVTMGVGLGRSAWDGCTVP